MTPWLIAAMIWGVGSLVWFRAEAGYLVTRKNWPRARAIREARNTAPWWPLAALFWIGDMGWTAGKWIITAGIPESRADRDARIAELESEVLGATDEAPADRMHRSLQEALNGTTADEDEDRDIPGGPRDAEFLDWLERMRVTCGPDTRLPSGKTLTSIRPAYLPRSYRDDYRAPDTHRTPDRRESRLTEAKHAVRDQEAAYEAVTQARRAVELLDRLRALGVHKDPATGHEIGRALRKARHVLQDAESGHLMATQITTTKTQVSRLERVLKAQEITQGTNAKVCTRCGCPVVQGRLGHIHVPTLGCPSPCDRATIAPVPWYLTPEDSPEREAVRRRTEERLRRLDDTEEAEDRRRIQRELQEEFPVELEPDVIRSISLDGTETEIQINRLQLEGYTITYLDGNEPPQWNGMTTRRIREELTKNSTLSTTRAIHNARHKDSPTMACPFCAIDALE